MKKNTLIKNSKSVRFRTNLAIVTLCIPSLFSLLFLNGSPYFGLAMVMLAVPFVVVLIPLLILVKDSSTCIKQERLCNAGKIESIKIAFLCGFSIYLFIIFYLFVSLYETGAYRELDVKWIWLYVIIATLSLLLAVIFARSAFSKADEDVIKKEHKRMKTETEIKNLKSARFRAWLAVIIFCLPGLFALCFLGEFYWVVMTVLTFPTLIMLIPLLILVKDASLYFKQVSFLNTRKVEETKIAFLCGFTIYLVVTAFVIYSTSGMNATLMCLYIIVNVLALSIGMAIALSAFSKVSAKDSSKIKKIFRILFYVFVVIYFIATSVLIIYFCQKVDFLLLCGCIAIDLFLFILIAKLALRIFSKARSVEQKSM